MRLLSRLDNTTSELAGKCGDCYDYNHIERLYNISSFADVNFGKIRLTAKISDVHIVLSDSMLSEKRMSILNLETERVTTVGSLTPSSVCIDHSGTKLYFTTEYGLGVMDLQTYEIEWLTSSNGNTGHIDGSLLIARLSGNPSFTVYLSTNILMIADTGNSALRVLDLVNETFSTVCHPDSAGSYTDFTLDCHYFFPQSLLVVPEQGLVHVGLYDKIATVFIDGKYYRYCRWQLTYSIILVFSSNM